MAIYGPNGGVVIGQPISPFFGAQNGASPPGGPIIQQPTSAPVTGGMQATGVQMSMLEACSRGLIPRNAQLSTIAGQSVSSGISASQGDGVTVDEAFSEGNGTNVNLGVAVTANANNPNAVETAGIDNQIFVGGTGSVDDAVSTGQAPTNLSSVVEAPLPGATTTANVGLLAGVFSG
jgi:hypothetical protein